MKDFLFIFLDKFRKGGSIVIIICCSLSIISRFFLLDENKNIFIETFIIFSLFGGIIFGLAYYRYESSKDALLNQPENIPKNTTTNKDFTTARQVLAITTLLSELNVNSNNSDKTEIARFIQMLTNKELGASRIQDTNIYKKYLSGTGKTDKNYTKDAEFVAGYFESLGLSNLAKKLKQ